MFTLINLPPREPGFLARYPRKLKLMVACAVLVLAAFPFLMSVSPDTLVLSKADQDDAGSKQSITEQETSIDQPSLTGDVPPVNQPNTQPTTGKYDEDAIRQNDLDDGDARMAKAPVAEITEIAEKGELPKIAEDGREPWQVYARPYNKADKRPKIAIVITDLGISNTTTQAVIRQMHANVTLAFDVQSSVIASWLGSARQQGHELLLSLPMEPFDYPQSDPGANTLLTGLANADNLQRLQWALRQGRGYVGITTTSGSRFTTEPSKIKPVMETLKQRGLMMLDLRLSPHSVVQDLAQEIKLPLAVSQYQIDQNLSPEAIDNLLTTLEREAQQNGSVIAIASPLPLTLDKLKEWIKTLPGKNISLAPLTAVINP